MYRFSGRRGERPRQAAVRLSLVLVVFVVSSLGAAARGSAQAGGQDQPVSLHTSFDHYWRRYLLASSSGDAETANRMLDEIKRLRVERNAFDLEDIGTCFVYQGFAQLDSGNLEEARKNFGIARELDPDLPTAYWGLARLSARRGVFSYLSAVAYRIRAQLVALRSERDGAYASWNLVYLLAFTFAVVFSVFALLMLYRYAVLLYHDLEERLEEHLSERGLLAATIAILALPVILTAGVGWLAPYWLAVTFGYQTVKERTVSILGLLLLLATAPFAELYSAWAKTSTNPLYQASLSSLTGTFDMSDVTLLRRAAKEHPEDRDLQFLLATQYKNLGDYELAATQYRKILDAFPEDLDSRMNLGNIYFAQLDWEGALVQYNQVINEDPQAAMAYYNKSLAHAENFQFAEREEARLRAESLDAAAVAAHERRTGDYRVVADARLDDVAILGKFYGLSEGMNDAPAPKQLQASVLGGLRGWGFRFLVAPILFGALILVLEIGFKDRRLIQRCQKCGSAFCGRCQIGTGRKGLCTQCYHLFFMRDGVSASARNDKLGQVQQASRLRALVFRLLSVLAPGAGHIGEGGPLLGTMLLFLWCLGIISLVLGASLYSLPDGLLGLGGSVPMLLVGMLVLVFLAANLVARPTGGGT